MSANTNTRKRFGFSRSKFAAPRRVITVPNDPIHSNKRFKVSHHDSTTNDEDEKQADDNDGNDDMCSENSIDDEEKLAEADEDEDVDNVEEESSSINGDVENDEISFTSILYPPYNEAFCRVECMQDFLDKNLADSVDPDLWNYFEAMVNVDDDTDNDESNDDVTLSQTVKVMSLHLDAPLVVKQIITGYLDDDEEEMEENKEELRYLRWQLEDNLKYLNSLLPSEQAVSTTRRRVQRFVSTATTTAGQNYFSCAELKNDLQLELDEIEDQIEEIEAETKLNVQQNTIRECFMSYFFDIFETFEDPYLKINQQVDEETGRIARMLDVSHSNNHKNAQLSSAIALADLVNDSKSNLDEVQFLTNQYLESYTFVNYPESKVEIEAKQDDANMMLETHYMSDDLAFDPVQFRFLALEVAKSFRLNISLDDEAVLALQLAAEEKIQEFFVEKTKSNKIS